MNADNANHQVLATKGQFVSAILKRGQKFSFTFTLAGTYALQDELHPKLTGKIVVKGPPPTLTLAASAPIVVYGTKVTLTGVVSNHAAGEQVTIYYQPYPQPNLIQRATVLTAAGGTFSFLVEPQVLTTYQAPGRAPSRRRRPSRCSRSSRSAAPTPGSSTRRGGRSFAGPRGAVPAPERARPASG